MRDVHCCHFIYWSNRGSIFWPPTAGGCRLVAVALNFCLSVVLEKRIQYCFCIVPCILLWYLSLVAGCCVGVVQHCPNLFVVDCDRVLWAWGWINDQRNPSVCTKWAVLVLLMVRLGWWPANHKFGGFASAGCLLSFYLETTLVQVVGSSNWVHCGFMVTTRSQHYCSPSPASSQGRSWNLLDVEPVVAPDEALKPISAWGIATRSHVHLVESFEDVEGENRGGIRDRFFGRVGIISLQDWKIWFRTWMREKRQRNTNFND